jgi:RNA polymerase sigma-70 factor (ECF subfamily)
LKSDSNSQSFESIYQAYGERILNLAFRLSGNRETARDLTQEIFIKIYENLATFEGKSHIYTWIYRIAVNHIYSHLKRERRYKWLDLLDKSVSDSLRKDQLDPGFRMSSPSPSPQNGMQSSQRAEIVWNMIQSLPTKYRVPLVLHHYEELSYKEIAEAMGLSLSAVEARIHRAKKQLIKKLEPWLDKI